MTSLRPLLRVSDIARVMECSEDTILRDISAGLLTALKRPKGRAFLIRPEAFEEYLRGIEYVPGKPIGPRRVGSAKQRRYSALATGRA